MGRHHAEGGSVGLAVLASVGVVLLAIGVGVGVGMAVAPDTLLGDWRAAYEERDPDDVGDPDDDGVSSGEGTTYGDDPELDALWDACDDGDLDACDTLFIISPIGSEYEDFGATCGGRESDDFFGTCGEGGLGADRPSEYGDDPFLDELYDACEGGDLAECDTLFWSSPPDSGYEAFGATCGERVEEGFGDCEERAG